MSAVDQYREAERELQVIRQRCNEQSDQLVQKSGMLRLNVKQLNVFKIFLLSVYDANG